MPSLSTSVSVDDETPAPTAGPSPMPTPAPTPGTNYSRIWEVIGPLLELDEVDGGFDTDFRTSDGEIDYALVKQTVDRMIAKGSVRLNDQGEVVTVSDETLRSEALASDDDDSVPETFQEVKEKYADFKQVYTVQTSDELYGKWQQQVDALRPKKRKNWKSYLTDKYGQRSSVRYNTELEIFENWSLIFKVWAKVVNFTTAVAMRSEADVVSNPFTAVGAAVAAGMDVGVDITAEAVQASIEANHTGNHYRNTSVKVPSSVYGRK